MLLEREDVNPDQPDTKYGRTPLSWAATKGHESVVKMLLEREDVNPDQPDIESGRTPLSWAAGNGHEGVVKILLARDDVNPYQPDTEYGLTSSSWAIQNGHDGVVIILSERGTSALLDNKNQNPLPLALPQGPPGVASILVERPHPDSSYFLWIYIDRIRTCK